MKRMLLLALAGLCLQGSVNGQVTVTYPQRSANYYASFTAGTAGSFDQGSYQLGMYANSSGAKQSVRWRKFRTDGGGSSTSDRAMQVGDVFTVTLSATRAYGRIGFALLASPSSTASWNDRENNYALSINLDGPQYTGGGYGNWYAKYASGATSAGSANVAGSTSYKDFTFTITLLARDRANVSITDGSTTSNLYEIQLNTTSAITDYSVFLEDDYNGAGNQNIYWGLGAQLTQHSLYAAGDLPYGTNNTTTSVSSIIPNGLAAFSSSTTSVNTLTKTGTGTLTLTAANTYTGLTTINNGKITLARSGGGTLPSTNSVTVNNGGNLTVNSNQTLNNLTINSGGTVTVASGVTLTINGTCQVSAASAFNGTGNITIGSGGTLQINNGGSAGTTNTISYSGGNLIYVSPSGNTGIEWASGQTPASITLQGGTLSLSGNRQAANLVLTAGALNAGSNTLSVSGNITRTSGAINPGTGVLEFNGSSAQSVAAGSFSANIANLTINNSGAGVTFNDNQTVGTLLHLAAGSLSMNGNTLTIASGASIRRTGGSLAAAPTFAGASVDIVYNNSSTLTTGLELPSTNIINNLTLNNTAVVTLGKSITVNGSLILGTGILDLGAFNLTLNPNSSSGSSSTSYVRTSGSGALIIGNVTSGGAFFPVGASSYNPVTISGAATQDWSVRVDDGVTNVAPQLAGNTAKAVSRMWHLTPSLGSPLAQAATVTFQYNDATDAGASFDKNGAVRVWHYEGTKWMAVSGRITPTGSPNGVRTVSVSGLSSFSPFAISNFDAPLPVSLLSFTGKRNGMVNELKWKTASESNNRGFAIERSADGVTFTQVGFTVSRATGGNSTSDISYSYTDAIAAGSKWYYRLKQVDLDGQYKYSAVVLLKGEKSGMITVEGIYPNPVKATANIRLQAGATGGNVVLQLSDMLGKLVRTQTVNTEAGAATTVQLNLDGLAAGQYHLKALAGSEVSEAVTLVKQ